MKIELFQLCVNTNVTKNNGDKNWLKIQETGHTLEETSFLCYQNMEN